MRDDDEVRLQDMIAIEQVANELWRHRTGGTEMTWETLSVLAKQAWRNRARMELAIRRPKVPQL
jgi:hypothetical protein